MSNFKVTDRVITAREIRAGRGEDGPHVCSQGLKGEVVMLEPNEWDSIHVKLDNGIDWGLKPSQLELAKQHT